MNGVFGMDFPSVEQKGIGMEAGLFEVSCASAWRCVMGKRDMNECNVVTYLYLFDS